MRETQFENYLRNDPSITSDKSVSSRMAKARKAEAILSMDLDEIVLNDDRMYEALLKLKKSENTAHSPMQNALRKYYKFANKHEFPRIKDYHSPKHP